MSDHQQLIQSIQARIQRHEQELAQSDVDVQPLFYGQTLRNLAICHKLLAELRDRVPNWLHAIKYLERARDVFQMTHTEAHARTEYDLARLYLSMARMRDAATYLWLGKAAAQNALGYYTIEREGNRAEYYELQLCLAELHLGLSQIRSVEIHTDHALKIAQGVARTIQASSDTVSDRQLYYIDAHRIAGLSYIVQARHAQMPATVDYLRQAIQTLGVVRKYRHHQSLAEALIRALHVLANAYHMLAQIEGNTRHLDYAMRALEQAIVLNPPDRLHTVRAANLQLLSVLLARTGDHATAAATATEAAYYFGMGNDPVWMWIASLQATTYSAPTLVRWFIVPLWWLVHFTLWIYHKLTGRVQL